jgi:prephenate dehydrogenase
VDDPFFRKIAIVGVGLVGGSIAQAAARTWPSLEIMPIDAGDDLARVDGAGLVILAAPVRTNIGILSELPRYLQAGTPITDVGSTKRDIVDAAEALSLTSFIGGHPMAGAERGGRAHARPDLFAGRPWILTPTPGTGQGIELIERFIEGIGGVPHIMTPQLHDRFVGAVSHLPQLTISALMHVVGRLGGDAGLELAGSGLLHSTRLASSPPDIWKDIAATNQDNLREALDTLIGSLTELRDGLGSGQAIDEVFTSACRWREALQRARGEER